jgi:hypothetical protein
MMGRKGRCQKLEAEGAFPIGFGARLRRFFVTAVPPGRHSWRGAFVLCIDLDQHKEHEHHEGGHSAVLRHLLSRMPYMFEESL